MAARVAASRAAATTVAELEQLGFAPHDDWFDSSGSDPSRDSWPSSRSELDSAAKHGADVVDIAQVTAKVAAAGSHGQRRPCSWAHLTAVLKRSGLHVVAGPGGIGETSLAWHLARTVAAEGQDRPRDVRREVPGTRSTDIPSTAAFLALSDGLADLDDFDG